MAESSWGPDPDFLAEQPSITDPDGDPAGNLGEIVGSREDVIDAGLARTADPTATSSPRAEYGRQAPAISPVYERTRHFGNPLLACVFCKHFERVHAEALTKQPGFMRFITHEAKFVAPDALGPEGAPVRKPWFDTEMLGRCAMDSEMVTTAMANCAFKPSQWVRKPVRGIVSDAVGVAAQAAVARLFRGFRK